MSSFIYWLLIVIGLLLVHTVFLASGRYIVLVVEFEVIPVGIFEIFVIFFINERITPNFLMWLHFFMMMIHTSLCKLGFVYLPL